MIRTKTTKLSTQVKNRAEKPIEEMSEYSGNSELVVSTGSTLLDLAISGTRIRGGGIPIGIMVEISGPESSGKTVLLSEIAGNAQHKNGDIMFFDPEGRLNKPFAKLFGLKINEENYATPNTVVTLFKAIRKWVPANTPAVIVADSLAALSTEMEMEKEDGDKMGAKRAKDFSQECRKTCLVLKENNLLLVCSNQLRMNMNAGPYGEKYSTPGGKAIPYYSSLRLRCKNVEKLKREKSIAGKPQKRTYGIETEIHVIKSTVDKPFRAAPVRIIFDYGIDDIGVNLQFIKDNTTNKTYTIGGDSLGTSLDAAIGNIENSECENKLREEVIDLWEAVEQKFKQERKPKR